MRLLLIVLTCLVTCLAAPQAKQKRDILPGDPRYESDHLHHHLPDATKSVGEYSYSVPQVPLPEVAYGPPGYQPAAPFNNHYLPPVADVTKHSTPVPAYGVPDTVHVAELVDAYAGPEATNSVTSATLSVPLKQSAAVAAAPPSTSYGIPAVAKNLKATALSSDSVNTSNRSTVKTIKTEIQQHHDVATPPANNIGHAPFAQDAAAFSSGVSVRTVPAVTTTVTKDAVPDSLLSAQFPSPGGSYPGAYGLPNYPSTLYPTVHHSASLDSFDTIPSGYSYPPTSVKQSVHLDGPPPLPLSIQVTKNIPTFYSLPRTVQLPHSLTKVVEHVQPQPAVHSLYSLPASVSSVESVSASPAQLVPSTGRAVETIRSVESVEPLDISIPQAVQSVKPVASAQLQPVHTVKSVSAVGPVQESVNTVLPSHPVKSVEILQPPPQPVEAHRTIQHQEHVQVETQRGPISDFLQNLSDNLSFPSFPFFQPFPSVPNFPTTVATPSPPANSVSAVRNQESVTVENPFLPNDQVPVTPVNDYVQPTDANGGYIY